jgi:RHS repeat-associated protein
VAALTDNAGNVVHEYKYSVFGEITEEVGDSVENPFTYTSREYDKETGNYFYRARYYDPQLGRFLSEDLIGLASRDKNFYRYCLNSSTNFTDPSGLEIIAAGDDAAYIKQMYPIWLSAMSSEARLRISVLEQSSQHYYLYYMPSFPYNGGTVVGATFANDMGADIYFDYNENGALAHEFAGHAYQWETQPGHVSAKEWQSLYNQNDYAGMKTRISREKDAFNIAGWPFTPVDEAAYRNLRSKATPGIIQEAQTPCQ